MVAACGGEGEGVVGGGRVCRKLLLLPLFYLGGEGLDSLAVGLAAYRAALFYLLHFEKVKIHSPPLGGGLSCCLTKAPCKYSRSRALFRFRSLSLSLSLSLASARPRLISESLCLAELLFVNRFRITWTVNGMQWS